MRGKLAWLAHSTRRDLSFLVAKLSQVHSKDMDKEIIKLLEKAVNQVHYSKETCS